MLTLRSYGSMVDKTTLEVIILNAAPRFHLQNWAVIDCSFLWLKSIARCVEKTLLAARVESRNKIDRRRTHSMLQMTPKHGSSFLTYENHCWQGVGRAMIRSSLRLEFHDRYAFVASAVVRVWPRPVVSVAEYERTRQREARPDYHPARSRRTWLNSSKVYCDARNDLRGEIRYDRADTTARLWLAVDFPTNCLARNWHN